MVVRNWQLMIVIPAYWSLWIIFEVMPVCVARTSISGIVVASCLNTSASVGMEDHEIILVQLRPFGRVARRRLSRRWA